MNAQPNYARMKGPGDFSPPDEREGFDEQPIRELLENSPKFVEEAFGEDVDWPAVARAWIDGDAIQISRLLGEAVEKSIDAEVERAIERYESEPMNRGPEGEIDPWRLLERDYGKHLKQTPKPAAPQPLDMRAFANGLIGGVRS